MCSSSLPSSDPTHVVIPNDDRISRPTAGRFFPLTVPQVLGLVKRSSFGPSVSRKRLDLVFRNPASSRGEDQEVAAFWPYQAVLVASFPNDFDHALAVALTRSALAVLAEVARQNPPPDGCYLHPSFHAYFGASRLLTVSERAFRTTRNKRGKYAGIADFLEPKGPKTVERVVRILALSDCGPEVASADSMRPLEWQSAEGSGLS